MNKFTRLVAGVTCVAAIGASFAGCGAFMEGFTQGLQSALGGGTMTDAQTVELATAFASTYDYTGPYAIEEVHAFTSPETGNDIQVKQKATYDTNGNMYFYNDLTDMVPDEVPFTVYTTASVGVCRQYVDYKNGKTMGLFTDFDHVKTSGQRGRHLITGEEIVVYFDSVGSAMSNAFAFDLAGAAECTTERDMSTYLWNYSQMIMANELTALDMAGLQNHLTFTREGSNVISDGENSVYTFKYEVTSDENDVADEYACEIRAVITVNEDERVSAIALYLVHGYLNKTSGVRYMIDGGFADTFTYRYNESWIPNVSNWN